MQEKLLKNFYAINIDSNAEKQNSNHDTTIVRIKM
jgi:hypothetical protein